MRTIFLFCALFIYTVLDAQIQTFKGYYITNNGDTIKGVFPKYTQWNNNPNEVEFFQDGNAKSEQLTPSNCRKFLIENYDEYLSYSGKRLINPIEDNVAVDNRGYFDFHDRDSSVTTFLRLVIRTTHCEIYAFTDPVRTNFFYRLPGGEVEELKFKMYSDESKIHEVAEYRQQLNNLFAEEIIQKKFSGLLEDLPYREEAIKKFIEKTEGIKQTKEVTESSFAGWCFAAGTSVNFFRVTGEKSFAKVQTNYSTSIAPFLSVGYILPFKRNFGRYFIYPQLRIYNYKNSGKMQDGSFTRTVTFQSNLMIVPELNAGANLINKENVRLFLYGGVGMLFTSKNREIDKLIVPADGSEYASAELRLTKMTYNVNLSPGICINNKIVGLITYRLPVSLGQFGTYSPTQSSVQIGVGYKLKN